MCLFFAYAPPPLNCLSPSLFRGAGLGVMLLALVALWDDLEDVVSW